MTARLDIPHADPGKRILRFGEDIRARIDGVLRSGSYVLNGEVQAFESAFADYLGIAHSVAVNSGTDAIVLALRALGVRPGAEVITVAMTASATASAVVLAGCVPRFVDIDPQNRCIDLSSIEKAITRETAAIVPVHLHGHPVDMPRLMTLAARNGLFVVEDCAQAHGARWDGRLVGTFGHLGAFSFYPTKNLGGVGDGGAVVTGDDQLAARLSSLRSYGWSGKRGVSTELGSNSRLDEIQAAILSVLLPHLDAGNSERAMIAAEYRAALAELAGSGLVELPPEHDGATYHQFAIALRNREAVRAALSNDGIGTGLHYDVPIHRQPAFTQFKRDPLPMTEHFAASCLSLPIQPEVVGDRAVEIAGRVASAVSKCSRS